ncbi:MAG TPA: ferredoxin [Nocardioides sp.]
MRIIVDKALCSGHARCHAVDEDLFPVDDIGYLEPEDQDVPEGLLEVARRGMSACPERAIALSS